jgi:hypothetical protein
MRIGVMKCGKMSERTVFVLATAQETRFADTLTF